MNYLEQLEASLPEQRDRFRRMRNGHLLALLVIDTLAIGLMLAWMEGHPLQPLWKMLVISICGFVMTGWNLWWAAFYDSVVNHTEATMTLVTRRNREGR